MKEKYLLEQLILRGRLSLSKGAIKGLKQPLSAKEVALYLTDTEDENLPPNLIEVDEKLQLLQTQEHDLKNRLKLAAKKYSYALEIEQRIEETNLKSDVESEYGEQLETLSIPLAKPTTSDRTPMIAEAMLEYIDAKEKQGIIKASATLHKGPVDSPYRGYTPTFRLFLAATDNTQTSQLNMASVNKFKEIVSYMKHGNVLASSELMKFDYKENRFVKPLSEILLALEKDERKGLGQKTIQDYYAEVSTFIDWLALENDYASPELASRARRALTPKKVPKGSQHAEGKNYELLTIEQIQKLTLHPAINPQAAYKKRANARPFHEADFWLPLLALFTGARGGELAQLYTKDIKKEGRTWCISINLEGAGKKLKNKNSIRNVPIHSKLIEFGILDFHREQVDAGQTLLFPKLWESQIRTQDPYKAWGSWFRRNLLKNHLGVDPGSKEVFHSFRGTFITELQRQDVPEEVRKQIVGHSKGSEAHSKYAKGRVAAALKKAIEKAGYSGIDFSHIHWKDYRNNRL